MDNLVEDNIKLVDYVLRKDLHVSKRDEFYEDIYSECVIGLIKASKTFDESIGLKFSTYASVVIRNCGLMYFREYVHSNGLCSKKNYDIAQKFIKLKSTKAVAEVLEITEDMVTRAVNEFSNSKKVLSLDYPIDGSDGTTYLYELIGDNEFDEQLISNIALYEALSALKEDERIIIHELYINEISQGELAKKLNKSQAQISRSANNILKKIKKAIETGEEVSDRRQKTNIEFNGKKQSLAKWCKELGVPYSTSKNRYEKGYSLEKVFSKNSFRGNNNNEEI